MLGLEFSLVAVVNLIWANLAAELRGAAGDRVADFNFRRRVASAASMTLGPGSGVKRAALKELLADENFLAFAVDTRNVARLHEVPPDLLARAFSSPDDELDTDAVAVLSRAFVDAALASISPSERLLHAKVDDIAELGLYQLNFLQDIHVLVEQVAMDVRSREVVERVQNQEPPYGVVAASSIDDAADWLEMAQGELETGRADVALALAEKAESALRSLAASGNTSTLDLHFTAMMLLAGIRRDRGELDGPEGSYALYARCEAYAQRTKSPSRLAAVLFYMGVNHEMSRRHDGALALYERAQEIARADEESDLVMARTLLRQGTVLTKEGLISGPGGAEDRLLTSVQSLERLLDDGVAGRGALDFAVEKYALALASVDPDAAGEALENVAARIPAQARLRRVQSLIAQARVRRETADPDGAVRLLHRALYLADRDGFAHQAHSAMQALREIDPDLAEPDAGGAFRPIQP